MKAGIFYERNSSVKAGVYYQNGMRKSRIPGMTVESVRNELPPNKRGSDIWVEEGSKLRKLDPKDEIREGMKVRVAPANITKAMKSPIENAKLRVLDECELLSPLLSPKQKIRRKIITSEGKRYIALEISVVPVPPRKFGHSNTDALFLIPASYPELPPIGCYFRYEHKGKTERERHLHGRSFYGAPDLTEENWYWFCAGVGGSLTSNPGAELLQHWKPSAKPDNGTNLTDIYNALLIAVERND